MKKRMNPYPTISVFRLNFNQQLSWVIFVVLLGTLLFPISVARAQQWRWENSPIADRDLFDVAFANDSVGWTVGIWGAIFNTTDGGTHWNFQTNPSKNLLYALSVVDANTVWAVGDFVILYTKDGGKEWVDVTPERKQQYCGVSFLDQTHGWVIEVGGNILKTTNGGINWQTNPLDSIRHTSSICFLDAKRGWLTCDSSAYRTTDGGDTWISQMDKVRGARNLQFTDKNNGWFVFRASRLYGTTDGGNTWQLASFGIKGVVFNRVQFLDVNNGWAVGDRYIDSTLYNYVYNTTDGGAAWSEQAIASAKWLRSGFFTKSGNGWVVGTDGNIFRSTDKGATWVGPHVFPCDEARTKVESEAASNWVESESRIDLSAFDTTSSIKDPLTQNYFTADQLAFASPTHWWAAPHHSRSPNLTGRMFTTTDAGQHWSSDSFFAGKQISQIRFLDSLFGWLGPSYRTSDGGKTWFQPFVPREGRSFEEGSLDYTFIDSLTGWLLGFDSEYDYSTNKAAANTLLFETNDGGLFWRQRPLSMVERPNQIRFANRNHGWIVGHHGTIYHTGDGSKSWSKQESGTPFQLINIFPIDSLNCWVSGADLEFSYLSVILHTNDGGKSWREVKIENAKWTPVIAFSNPDVGWITGEEGTLYHTKDGGRNWTKQKLSHSESPVTIKFFTDSTGVAVSPFGTIYHYRKTSIPTSSAKP